MDVNKKYVHICHGVSYLFNITFTVQFGKLIEFSKKKNYTLWISTKFWLHIIEI